MKIQRWWYNAIGLNSSAGIAVENSLEFLDVALFISICAILVNLKHLSVMFAMGKSLGTYLSLASWEAFPFLRNQFACVGDCDTFEVA
jgi:hypothetical protein